MCLRILNEISKSKRSRDEEKNYSKAIHGDIQNKKKYARE